MLLKHIFIHFHYKLLIFLVH